MVLTIVSSLIQGENKKYEEAVKTLNTLQTNAQTLEKIRQERDKRAHGKFWNMFGYAARAGITEDDMNRLNIIHVSGTKGKGSTCAFCESILRHHGYKTGFFSSPHLVEVRERFVVDGSPLDREKFAVYFWEVYNKLDKTKEQHEGKMPHYFGFLTVMAMHVFLKEQVDVAVIEVGIGGQFDSTNIIRKPVVCGVTSLGLDHTSILGNTIDKIAWYKAGIFKPGVPAFTSPQVPEAMAVLADRAQEIGVPLTICPDLSVEKDVPPLGIKGKMQSINASLALQICQTWIKHYQEEKLRGDEARSGQLYTNKIGLQPDKASQVTLTTEYIQGLSKCQWLGRNQMIKEDRLTYYLDGAHTLESIEQCVEWFKEEAQTEKDNLKKEVYKVLIFNMTGNRDVETLLKQLQTCNFDAVLFCPNIAYETAIHEDQNNRMVTKESQLRRCTLHKTAWEKLESRENCNESNASAQSEIKGHVQVDEQSPLDKGDTVLTENSEKSKGHITSNTIILTFTCISDCIEWLCRHRLNAKEQLSEAGVENAIQQNVDNSKGASNFDPSASDSDSKVADQLVKNKIENAHLQVLVTGSLHLVGGALKVIWDKELMDD